MIYPYMKNISMETRKKLTGISEKAFALVIKYTFADYNGLPIYSFPIYWTDKMTHDFNQVNSSGLLMSYGKI